MFKILIEQTDSTNNYAMQWKMTAWQNMSWLPLAMHQQPSKAVEGDMAQPGSNIALSKKDQNRNPSGGNNNFVKHVGVAEVVCESVSKS